VYASFNGTQALDKIKILPVLPDLIISDIMMDKVDGFTFAKIISKDPACNHIPFIFLSAKSTKQDKLLGLKLGAIDFIQKPFSIQELIQKTESILTNVQRQKKALLRIVFKASGIHDLRQNFTDTFEQNCKSYNLTSREKDIAKLIGQGYKYKEIGEALFIAERTVTKHVQNIFEKTDVKNKIGMINKLVASEITTKQLNY
jgi:two-component system sensor histidine kinase ChiS